MRLHYVARRGRSVVKERRCARRGCARQFVVTTMNRRQQFCSKSCAAIVQNGKARRKRDLRYCLGYPGHNCHQVVRRKSRCEPCREKYSGEIAKGFEERVELSPKVCGLAVRGKLCLEPVLFQVNRAGRTVLWCNRHGERLMPVLKPGDVGYPKVA